MLLFKVIMEAKHTQGEDLDVEADWEYESKKAL